MLSQFFLSVKVFSEKIHKKAVSTYAISDGAMSDNGIFHFLTAHNRRTLYYGDCRQQGALWYRWKVGGIEGSLCVGKGQCWHGLALPAKGIPAYIP
jgi:hypothetical protein